MNVLFNHLLSHPYVSLILDRITIALTPMQKKVALIGIAFFSGVTLAYFSCIYSFKAKKKDATEQDSPPQLVNQKTDVAISTRLEKNRNFAKEQQNTEISKGFVLTRGKIPRKGVKVKVVDEEGKKKKKRSPIKGEGSSRRIGIASCEGCRDSMEDAHLATNIRFTVNHIDHTVLVFGVFDGHGGTEASVFVKQNLDQYLKEAFESNNQENLTEEGVFKALKACFEKLGEDYTGGDETGTTATVAILLGDKIWVANVGDSRTILVKQDGTVIQASEDAKPMIARYQKKIERLGGFIDENRVNGVLGVARAIGDKVYKGNEGKCCVLPNPKITNYPLDNFKRGYLVLACDGVYDVSTTAEMGSAIKQMADKREKTKKMAKRIVYSVISRGSQDNVSVVVVSL